MSRAEAGRIPPSRQVRKNRGPVEAGVEGGLRAGRWTYAGMFTVALATLMFEILLTRIFSVTMYYHFAFVAISVAMFGMTAGAMLVFLMPRLFQASRVRRHLAVSTVLFAATSLGSFLVHLLIPAFSGGRVEGFNAVAPTYVLMTVPFIFSGVAVCLVLTRHAHQVSRLYAADLAGAALGCVGTIAILEVTDGPTAVVWVAALAALAAAFFAMESGERGLLRATAACAVLLGLLASAHTVLVWRQSPVLRLFYVKGQQELPPLYEKWNSFSRVTVHGREDARMPVSGWGLSPRYPRDRSVRELDLRIDSSAGTRLTAFSGDLRGLDHLRFDIVNLVHYLKQDADVLVIGAGGGRDILSALAFGQRSVVGVEINGNIIRAVNERFGDFTGHLDRDPRVTFVNDEARSYIARQNRRFDIIQISLIDTWAATAAGAFVLSENSLYTVEAWKIFLQHLNPGGVLTITRWYFRDRPSEVYRVTTLAHQALRELGAANPRDHIVIARLMRPGGGASAPDGVGTLLLSPTPFTPETLGRVEQVAAELGFDIALSPRTAIDQAFERLMSPKDMEQAIADYPLNIAPTTDDSPFFFHMMRLQDVLDPALRRAWEQGANRIQLNAVTVLATLLAVVLALSALFIFLPLLMAGRGGRPPGAGLFFQYFASIGMGFMLIEISQMQRLVVFLGHPTYALSVVLFALLLSSGLGSFMTRWLEPPHFVRNARVMLAGLLGAVLVFGMATPRLAAAFESSPTPLRIVLAGGILFVLGLFMGMAFPIGMKLAGSVSSSLTPWLWGVNGAMSVLASVVAVVLALQWGISASFWTGFVFYLLAAVAFVRAAVFMGK